MQNSPRELSIDVPFKACPFCQAGWPYHSQYHHAFCVAEEIASSAWHNSDTKMVKTSAAARQVLDLFQHVHGDKGFEVPGINDPVNEPTVAPITGYNNPAPNGYQKAPKFQSKVGQLGSNPLLLPQRLLGLQARTSWQTMLLAEHPKPALTRFLSASCQKQESGSL